MRLLHTADWHLGRKLYDRPRIDEHQQFLQWLLGIIKAEHIDGIMVAGDVFDSSIPAAQVVDLYYQFLFQLYQETQAFAVIIAGNHDSATRLAAPRQFLKLARIHLVGSLPAEPVQYGFTIQQGAENVAIIALPYIPEGEILTHVSFETDIESARRYRAMIQMLYQKALRTLPEAVPKILMGHYFLAGSQLGESERPIQVGGSLPVTLEDLPPDVSYIALGHLHRPQSIKNHSCPVVYAGSPIPMTFKEAEYEKKVVIIDLLPDKSTQISEIVIPTFRSLVRVKGGFEDILNRAETEDWDGKLIEVLIELEAPQIGLSDQIRRAFAERGGEVASVQAQLISLPEEEILTPEDITTQSPEDIFKHFYLERYGQPEDKTTQARFESIQNTFNDLIQLWQRRQLEEIEP